MDITPTKLEQIQYMLRLNEEERSVYATFYDEDYPENLKQIVEHISKIYKLEKQRTDQQYNDPNVPLYTCGSESSACSSDEETQSKRPTSCFKKCYYMNVVCETNTGEKYELHIHKLRTYMTAVKLKLLKKRKDNNDLVKKMIARMEEI